MGHFWYNESMKTRVNDMTNKSQTSTDLNDKVLSLELKNEALESEVKTLQLKIRWYEEQARLAARKRFGASSEKTDQIQMDLFNEAEQLKIDGLVEPDVEIITYERKRRNKERKLDVSDLPVETIEYTIDDAHCPVCASSMHVMTKEIRRELKVIPAQLTVVEHVSYVYACRHCEQHEIKTPIIKAQSPNPVIQKSMVSPSLLSFIIDKKYVQAVPLYRQEQQFNHHGIAFLRQNLANWVIKGSLWLEHVYQRMKVHLLNQEILHADETTLQVLHEKDRKAQNKSFMWVYLTGHTSFPVVLYDYQETRAHQHPQNFLKTYKGYLHVDGYQGYNEIEGVTLVGCMAHARRKFDEAIKAAPKKSGPSESLGNIGLGYINKLFMIEKDIKTLSVEEKKTARNKRSLPLMLEFKSWLESSQRVVTPKSKLGEAIKYTLNQWEKLTTYLEDARLEISNNRAERAIKPFVIGRKNWLFANTPHGARASAVIYSVIETAKLNQCSPFHYLNYLFEQLPNMEINDETLDDLMPWSDQLPKGVRIKTNSPEKEDGSNA
jgi:transposase